MRAVGNKWFWLIVFAAGWTAAGFALFAKGSNANPAAAAESPQRIVAGTPSLTEILFALGLGDQVVGVTAYSNYPPEAQDKRVIGTFWQPDIEAVVAARPDLVVTEGFDQQAHLAQRLQRLGYGTVSVDIWSVAQLYEAINEIGRVTDRRREAAALLARIQNNIAQVSARMAAQARPKVLYVIQTSPLRVAGRQTFINELIELAGGQNAIGPTVNKYPPIGSEQVIASSPDVIIAPGMAGVSREALIEYFTRYGRIPAVANEQIYLIDDDTVSRLGPRIDQAVEMIARCIRPGIF
ncbi:MAG: ABC transporter substrate-binding protein [Phycisphaerae bacterium]|nr:ABC transporter substrate-binding protein [Phycisphaerae bacterium]